jgi:hypothetical protein
MRHIAEWVEQQVKVCSHVSPAKTCRLMLGRGGAVIIKMSKEALEILVALPNMLRGRGYMPTPVVVCCCHAAAAAGWGGSWGEKVR